MSKLVFAADDVRRVVEHSIAAPEQGNVFYTKKKVKSPAVLLVHDQGVYLMSNGQPRDIVSGESSFCAYAKGCDPKKDVDDWYDTARDLVGGGDFGETLECAEAMKKMLDDGATEIIVGFSATRLSLSAKYPKNKKPQTERTPLTAETLLAHLQKTMKKKAVGFDPNTGNFSIYKQPYSETFACLVLRSKPNIKFLNALPLSEVCKIVEQYIAAQRQKSSAA